MTSRREFLQIAAALAAIVPAGWSRAFAQQRLRQADLIDFAPLGNVTLVHVADLHAQLVPIYFREPSVNIGAGDARGRVPHLTGGALLDFYGIPLRSPAANIAVVGAKPLVWPLIAKLARSRVTPLAVIIKQAPLEPEKVRFRTSLYEPDLSIV